MKKNRRNAKKGGRKERRKNAVEQMTPKCQHGAPSTLPPPHVLFVQLGFYKAIAASMAESETEDDDLKILQSEAASYLSSSRSIFFS
ncbi:expressed unknown protein [Seminavis robusta]|uniref:Uncharacterized protein n=1 Tax=Seminavis robusta TaxID=568900 RepID=A0A9N8EWB1_9STRA|nr:expressed unknown protein [Seminavis robusta]|eukprot:Sro1890_g303690.1 n/a (87) ;mRNA; f:7697-7957